MAALAGDDTGLAARFAGFYKGIQSAGAAISWGLDVGIPYVPQFWICWCLFLISLPLVYIAVWDIESQKQPLLQAKSEEEDGFDVATRDMLISKNSKR